MCDGVSTCANDALASNAAVEIILNSLNENTGCDIRDALKISISKANLDLFSGVKGTTRLWTTLAILLYEKSSAEILIYTAGDTRIYGYKNHDLTQLSSDDTTSKPWVENGKIKYKNGQPLMYNYVTRSLGFDKSLDVQLQRANPHEFDAFIIASDGMYNLASFTKYVKDILNEEEMQDKLNDMYELITKDIKDDASIAILRLNHTFDNLQVNPLEQYDSLFEFERKSLVTTAFTKAFTDADVEELKRLVGHSDYLSLYTKNELIDYLDSAIKTKLPFEIVEKIKSAIRKAGMKELRE